MGINGSPTALAVDRAISELRRGRAIAISDGSQTLIVAALEAATTAMLQQLLSSAGELSLLVTAERAQAARLNGDVVGPVAISVHSADQLDTLKAYGGIAGSLDTAVGALPVRAWPGPKPLAAAAFRLAKAGRLVPALLGFATPHFADASVATVSLAAISETRLPLADAENTSITLFRDELSDSEHIAIVIGDPHSVDAVPVRLHSACLTGDVLGSLRCDCGEQLQTAVRRIAALGAGVLLYLDQEGRGIGLANKLRAYTIQDSGLDTLDADQHLGFGADERTYDVAAAMLQALGVRRIKLMTNNPQKIQAMVDHGIDVIGRLSLIGSTNAHNESYLRAKRERAGHLAEETGR
jgi:GTP cyclohydrolase II